MFINRSDLLSYNPAQMNYGVAVTDLDNDGKFEFLVAGYGASNIALKWDKDRYRNVINPVMADAGRWSISVAACDIDGDGREEIYVINADRAGREPEFSDRLFAQGWHGTVDLFSTGHYRGALNSTRGLSIACVDRNGTGRYGFFITGCGSPMCLYELNDDGILEDVAPAAGVNRITGGRGLVSFPLVSGKMDIFAGNENGSNFLFRNKGDGTFEEIADRVGIGDPYSQVRGIAALDTSHAGRLGLVYGNWEGSHRMFVQSSDGVWDDIAPPEMAMPSRIRTVIAADFDNDGYEELFFNNTGQPNRLFKQIDGEWQMVSAGDATEKYCQGTGAAVADLDGDGRLELLIAHGEQSPQLMALYQTAQNENAWLRVLPLTAAGAPARGAVVTLVGKYRTQTRVIDAGSGYLCQMEPVAHFGLGKEDSVQGVIVRYPDGTLTTVDSPRSNQLLKVPYPLP